MAMLGAMVGAGNIWRMPFTTGENGGGAFLVVYIILLFLIAVPGLMAETVFGSYTNRGVIGAFKSAFGEGRAEGLGLVVVLVNIALMSYYAPIIGWTMYYAAHSLLLTFSQEGFASGAFWSAFSGSPILTVGMDTIAMAATGSVLLFGIKDGIERVVKWMIPFLVIALIAVGIKGLTLPGAMDGLAFAFTPKWEYLVKPSTWIAALGQALFSTGLGWGIALTFGSYLSKNDDVPLGGGVFTAIGNTSIGLLAIFATFPAVFAFGLEPSAGSQLSVRRAPQRVSTDGRWCDLGHPVLRWLPVRDVLIGTRYYRGGRDDSHRGDPTEPSECRARRHRDHLAAQPSQRLLRRVPRRDGLHVRELGTAARDLAHHPDRRVETRSRTDARRRAQS